MWKIEYGIKMNTQTLLAPARQPIRSFTDLDTWKEGHKFVLMIYEATETFPQSELYGLTDQLRRAAVSITSNIAEGFRRKGIKDKMKYYRMSLSSLTETQNQLLIGRDVHYLTLETFQKIAAQSVSVGKLLNGLLSATKKM